MTGEDADDASETVFTLDGEVAVSGPSDVRWSVDGRVEASGDDGASVIGSMLVPYRHDVHKLRGRAHENAADSYAGVPVNQAVPLHADRDAALLSRPDGEPELTVSNHRSPYRLSLLSGESAVEDVGAAEIEEAVTDLVTVDDPVAAHQAWLDSWVASVFSESLFFPYTSLKYHTLLVAALVSNYQAGAEFDELHLIVDSTSREPTPHRTVLQTGSISLRVTAEPGDRPSAALGTRPARSFADVWSRLPEHPGDADDNRAWRVLDAQLRRIRSWSTGLQFIEDYVQWRGDEL